MANYGWVISRKKMTIESISQIMDELNKRCFKNNLVINTKSNSHWSIEYKSYAHRLCWLDSPHKFVVSHGGGTSFEWWINQSVLNEVAVKFNGTIHDDGCEEKIKGVSNKFDSFEIFLNEFYSKQRKDLKPILFQNDLPFIPEEFHFQELKEISTVVFQPPSWVKEIQDRIKR